MNVKRMKIITSVIICLLFAAGVTAFSVAEVLPKGGQREEPVTMTGGYTNGRFMMHEKISEEFKLFYFNGLIDGLRSENQIIYPEESSNYDIFNRIVAYYGKHKDEAGRPVHEVLRELYGRTPVVAPVQTSKGGKGTIEAYVDRMKAKYRRTLILTGIELEEAVPVMNGYKFEKTDAGRINKQIKPSIESMPAHPWVKGIKSDIKINPGDAEKLVVDLHLVLEDDDYLRVRDGLPGSARSSCTLARAP